MKEIIKSVAWALGLILLFSLVCVTGLAGLFSWAWNHVLPTLFGLPRLDYKQSVALLILIAIVTLVAKCSSVRVKSSSSY
jgi:hypothetical protein